jgi:hypothetical protein
MIAVSGTAQQIQRHELAALKEEHKRIMINGAEATNFDLVAGSYTITVGHYTIKISRVVAAEEDTGVLRCGCIDVCRCRCRF